MQQPSNTGGGATGELRSDAKQLGSKAADRLHSELDSRKSTAVTQAQSVSSAIGQTANSLDDSAPDWLKSAFQQGAQKIQQFADTIEEKDSRQILDEVQSFARERPALFLGACAAAGFAAARIFKAGGEQQSSQQFGQSASFGQAGSFEPNGSYDQDQAVGQAQPWGDADQSFDEVLGESRQSNSDPLIGGSTTTPGTSRGEFV